MCLCVCVCMQSPGLLRPTSSLTVQTEMMIKFIFSSLKEQQRPQSETMKEPYTHALGDCVRWGKPRQTPYTYIQAQVDQYTVMQCSCLVVNPINTAVGWFTCLWNTHTHTHTLNDYPSISAHTYTPLTHKGL